jgi:two-component system chemotaxis response regulator CheY
MAWLVSERSVEGRALVVDDEEPIRRAVSLLLKTGGYDVAEAANGAQAIEVLSSGDNPMMMDVIICDIRMPKVNGVEAIAYFGTQYPSIPVIVLTGYPLTDISTVVMKDVVVEYLQKPIDQKSLLAAVARAKAKRRFSFYP